jgi:DeoR/GlpR family transcriptional regulator of sugar metabolism
MMNRNVRILDILAAHKNIKVTTLAELLNVSQVTVRKDLDNLERKGLIHRSHGYASLDGTDDVGTRMAFNHLIKRRIAKAAAAMVDEGETVMIESGSCCALFAEELALAQKNVTIITNSAFIANYICRLPNIKIILLGGYFQPESQVLVGPMTAKCGEIFFSDKFFVGADGFIPGYGFTGKDHLRVETIVNLAERAKKIFVLTDAVKFHHRGVYNMMRLDRLAGVFTDDTIPKEAETALLENKVSLYKVPSRET